MPSQEVNDAIGEASERPKKNTSAVLDQLKQKQTGLANARERYATAKSMRDEDAMSDELRRIDSLLAIIPELEAEVADELETAGRRAADAWIATYRHREAVVGPKIKTAQTEIQEKLDQLIAAIAVEEKLRGSIVEGEFATEVLTMRFDLPPNTKSPTLPALRDYAMPVINATDVMRPSRRVRQKLVVKTQASDTPDTVREKRRDAVLRFVRDNAEKISRGKKTVADSLPREVWQILTEAPMPLASAAPKLDGDEAVIGTGPLARDAALSQAAAEIAALPRGVSADGAGIRRG
ncbi:MAG: hypothetical protein M3O61_12090 [Gemmatimonadota bacterium]|nr:hypothetical protein [Gemmatimonadota bacterium]